ncbi:CaiB/BaiF CoA-transferase family protein [Sinimarinibacterium sp. HSW-8]|uniref:CaiB/BaiF CoA-transferase family protein n=2 Tax=Sinimarinibacterium thermocellulolyticum TaxID=3170016 RepID=A0ABV2ADJ7_9GAMM
MAGIGPGPFAAMMLSDMGAEVVRVEAKSAQAPIGYSHPRFDVTTRGRRSITVDLKHPQGLALLLRLVEKADALIEGFRPGVMERLGLGPEVCLAKNPKLVFGRMTGWGQTGPLAKAAGHDLNYIAITGVLHAIGRADAPPPVPLNLIGDYGGGGMLLAFGVVCALLEAQRSGQGQVVDAAMTDGTALLSSIILGMKADGLWSNRRASNLLDGGAHFYDCYACADGKFVAFGALEPHFFKLFCEKVGLTDIDIDQHLNPKRWATLKPRLAELFRSKTRDEWCALLEGTDCCFAPVLDWDEAVQHPHNQARRTYIDIDGVTQPAPAPRFSRTPGAVQRPPARRGEHTDEILAAFGIAAEQIATLRSAGVI